jgi:tRNA A-37 threonylcarbamoyl transferase component Bud32/membrane-associated phospholipid phosphatase
MEGAAHSSVLGAIPHVPMVDHAAASPGAYVRPHSKRRPSGEPPALPRAISASGKWWLALALSVVGLWVAVALTRRTGVTLDAIDHAVLERIVALRTAWLTRLMKVVGAPATGAALQVLWLANLLVLLFWRRWRHLVVWIGAGLVVDNAAAAIGAVIHRPRPFGVEILGGWTGYAMPSLPLAVLAAFSISTLYSTVPAGRSRQWGKLAVAVVLAVVTASRLYLAQDSPSDALFGVVLGVTITLLAFRLFAPNDVFPVTYHRGRAAHLDIDARRHEAIRRALEDQLGLIATEAKPFGLAGSGGSTPLRIKVKGDPDTYVFGKLYAATHLRADRWYKLGRTLLYGRLEDEKAFNTVRRLVQYEDYALRLLHAAGLRVPHPYGIVELTPEREYLLVMEFFDGATEIGETEIDDGVIDQGLLAIRRLWEAGLAHRDIKPANVLVRDGQLLIIDSAFAQLRPSPWRQAVDLANMMLVLALRTDAPRVYARAREQFTDAEIAEAFAATRGLTMPSQLRRMLRSQGEDLHTEFMTLMPYRLRPVRIQRWSIRRLGLSAVVICGATLAAILAVQLIAKNPL